MVAKGTTDILTMALGTPEHPGRVRGMGACVTQTKYFHTPTPYRRSQQDDTIKKLEEMNKFWDSKFKQQHDTFQAMINQLMQST